MAIAQAVIEHIHDKIRARTLFSTHFHELTQLESTLRRLRSYRMEVEERAGRSSSCTASLQAAQTGATALTLPAWPEYRFL